MASIATEKKAQILKRGNNKLERNTATILEFERGKILFSLWLLNRGLW
jgi:hypothetical protein